VASYIDIYTETRKQIIAGDLKPGAKLPAHRQISDHYQVSIATVTKAINRLKREGLVRSYRGLGTIVADDTPERSAALRKTVTFITAGHPFIHQIFAYAVQEVFASSSWSVNTQCGHGNLEWYRQFLDDAHRHPPAGLIVATVPSQLFTYRPELLPHPNTHVVIMGHEIPGRRYDTVRTNAYQEGVELAEYLLAKGYRDVLYVTSSKEGEVPESQTLVALSKTLARHGVSFDGRSVRRYQDTHSYGPKPDPIIDPWQFTRHLLKTERPRANLAGHDWIALGVLRALDQAALRVPHDVAVISAEGTGSTGLIAAAPRLTTVDTLYHFRAKTAAELLKRRLEGDTGPIEYHETYGRVIEGETG